MDNSEVASTTQLDSGDIAAAVDVPDHLESGEPNIIALALAIHNHQEALKRGATATNAATEVPQEALIKKSQSSSSTSTTETETETETKTETKKTQEALKNKTKRLADDTLVYNILQQYSHVDI